MGTEVRREAVGGRVTQISNELESGERGEGQEKREGKGRKRKKPTVPSGSQHSAFSSRVLDV